MDTADLIIIIADNLSWLLDCKNLTIGDVIINISETIFNVKRNSGVVADFFANAPSPTESAPKDSTNV